VKRFLDLYSFGSGFTGHWRFAVVRDPWTLTSNPPKR
jgi:hypothetical protein